MATVRQLTEQDLHSAGLQSWRRAGFAERKRLYFKPFTPFFRKSHR